MKTQTALSAVAAAVLLCSAQTALAQALPQPMIEAIRQAREEVLLETFIIFEDKVGKQLQQVLIEAIVVELGDTAVRELGVQWLLAQRCPIRSPGIPRATPLVPTRWLPRS